ncbi:MAG: hypothetical protein HYV77_00195 [Candidatus Wildermuthbacteria bacterium]|nr:hypothetical protein [Candidatus Wildermuthbacteria bacterium]
MDSIIQADIFFFITTVALVTLTVILAVALIYIVKILRNIKHVTDLAKKESLLLSEDFEQVRLKIRQEGFKIQYLLQLLFALVTKGKKPSKTKKKEE